MSMMTDVHQHSVNQLKCLLV